MLHVPAARPHIARCPLLVLISCFPAFLLFSPADDDKSYWNQVASKLAEATSADELMSFHKWMPGGQDAAQALLNADKVRCAAWGVCVCAAVRGMRWHGGSVSAYKRSGMPRGRRSLPQRLLEL